MLIEQGLQVQKRFGKGSDHQDSRSELRVGKRKKKKANYVADAAMDLLLDDAPVKYRRPPIPHDR